MSIWIVDPVGVFCRVVVVGLPSRISLVGLFLLVPFVRILLILLNLILVNFNIISSVLGWDVRISRLLSSMMKSCFLLNWLFLVFKLLLSLISKINFSFIFYFLFLSVRHKIISFHCFSVVIFHFPSYFRVIDAFEVLFNGLFAVFGNKSLFDFMRLKFHRWSLLNGSLILNFDLFLACFIWLKFHKSIKVRFQMSDHVFLQQKIICSC